MGQFALAFYHGWLKYVKTGDAGEAVANPFSTCAGKMGKLGLRGGE
jgi:hypothetical protein